MNEQNKNTWSKALCLALLSTATKQKRAWHLIAFNSQIRRNIEVKAGQANTHLIQNALDCYCSGGTDFDKPILKAAEVIRTSKTMHQADVVIITDGESDLETGTIEIANKLTRSEGVSWFTIGVGHDAATFLQFLEPIATSMVVVSDTSESDLIIPVINLERAS